VLRAERPLDDVNAAFEAVLDGSAPAPRMVFDIAGVGPVADAAAPAAAHA
jgi:hypothetical protein